MFSFHVLMKCTLVRNLQLIEPHFHVLKSTLLQSKLKLLPRSLPQACLHKHCYWSLHSSQDKSILSSIKANQGNLHNVFPHWETTRGSKLKRTQQRIQETKRIVSEKFENMKQENIWTIPNGLCFLRIALTPILGYMVVTEAYSTALGIFILAGTTDLLDGYIARNFANQQSAFGSMLDPAADKLLVATLFLTLTVEGLIPIPLTALIVARDACLMGAAFYLRYASLPPPRTLVRYFNASLATARFQPTLISKINTSVQLSLVALTLAAPVFNYVDHPYLHALWYFTATTTVLSGLSYVVTKGTYTILTKSKKT